MNRYKLSKAGIRVSEGIARLGGDAEAYGLFLEKFPKDTSFQSLCDAVERRDAKAAFAAAHALKGEVGNLSMVRLYDDLAPLVEELRVGSLERADELLSTVRRDYSDVVAAIG